MSDTKTMGEKVLGGIGNVFSLQAKLSNSCQKCCRDF